MAAKTTKAQRRAAKLNRRSKDYRRQIAAQARKEERAKKPAKEQTKTRAKNPTPKKVYRKNDNPVYIPEYNPLRHVLFAVFGNTGDEIEVITGYAGNDLTPTEMENFIREDHPELNAIYLLQMPFGWTPEEAGNLAFRQNTVELIEKLLFGMIARDEWFYWTSLDELQRNLDAYLAA